MAASIHAPACATTPVPSFMLLVFGRVDGCASGKRRENAYRLRSCGTVAVPPAAKRLPSFREEAPLRWYQAVGILLDQPSLGLDIDPI
jgi:hypothetical protein